ncbi:ATP-binding cassette domain-containing protein [Haloarchaeobius sp. DFWS5]|uniref:ATP-binding cassette domain-containing protein n=1 Tax=Haloarchaeobius sp. DFWS5 TaxID=3446114 RepID=UPI003EBD120B
MSTTRHAIETRGLTLTYADGTEAVRGVDLEIAEGEFFGFLGPNGAGKTTTITLLSTLLSPTAGEIRVNGFDAVADAKSVRRTIGYMAQETSVDEELTARENIRFACEAYGVPKAERAERIDDLLELADLVDVADKQAKTFSGGMQKRLDAVTALVHRPPLVFLDEPTTGLDPSARNRLWDYFRKLNDEGTTVFLTTQYLEEADQLCDRIAVIDDGEIVAVGTPAELKARVGGDVLDLVLETPDEATLDRAEAAIAPVLNSDDQLERTETGLAVTSRQAREIATDLLLALRDADVLVTAFEVRSPTLDDVFLAITGEHVESEPMAALADGGSEVLSGANNLEIASGEAANSGDSDSEVRR